MTRQSTNDKGDEIKLGVVHISPGIYLTATKKPGKPQLGDLRKSLRLIIASNGVLCLQMMAGGSHACRKGGEREGKVEGSKERIGKNTVIGEKLGFPYFKKGNKISARLVK